MLVIEQRSIVVYFTIFKIWWYLIAIKHHLITNSGQQVIFYNMEIQKHLFRIAEKALKSPNAIFWWRSIFYAMSTLSIYFLITLVFGHTIVLPNNNDLSLCFKSQGLSVKIDSFYYVSDRELSLVQQGKIQLQNKTKRVTTECIIIENKQHVDADDYSLIFGWDEISMFMDTEKRNKMNYNNYTIFLKQMKPLRKIMFGFDNLIINQLLDNPLSLFQNDKILIKSRTAYVIHRFDIMTTFDKIWSFIKVSLSYLGISIVTSLYIYGTIIAAPAVILIILKVCNYLRVEGLNDVFKLFPWIGIHAVIRDTSTTPIIKESTTQICKAILLYFFFLYLVYYAIIIWIDKHLYKTHLELGLQEMLFGFVALTEFAAIVFMRTRTFIKYYPAIHSLLIISLLYYGQISDFGFKKLACYCAFTLSWSLFSWMVLSLQIPAHTTWDPNNPNTPKEDRPRAGYFPLFNMSWIKNLPEEWSLLMPLFGRQHFSTRQMAFVDHNNQQLALIMGNR